MRKVVAQAGLVEDLQNIVGAEHSFAPNDDFTYAVDDLNPRIVVFPGSYEEVAEVLRYANAAGLALIPFGTGSTVRLANVPRSYDLALSLRRLDEIVEYDPADLTVTSQAGVTTDQLRSHLADSGQMVPFGPVVHSSLGGLLAGRRVLGDTQYSSARDFTIGMRVVTADRRITRAGGKVVKNVAGYDLCKLYIGSLGTLAVIIEATLKTVPVPESHQRLCFEFSSSWDACGFSRDAQRRGFPFELLALNRFGGPSTPVETRKTVIQGSLAGTNAAIGRINREVPVLLTEFRGRPGDDHQLLDMEWTDAVDQVGAWPLHCSIQVLPTNVPSLIDALEGESVPAQLLAYPTLGVVAPFWPGRGEDEALLHIVKGTAARFGGTCSVQSCAPDLKRRIDVFGDPPPSFPLMRAIKQQFDPNGFLSPGRFVGRL